jgi:hypothetical protein
MQRLRDTGSSVTLKNRTISPMAQFFIDCARKVASGVGKRASRAVAD